ncbi:hypothetical protein Acr_21g0002510 [Actinidia rufa]|uniref:Uncharacterized protein n=1 Tax=Actinidia rufa TaxID=165716 RepID=A0A7J0GG04_9ERIC|nr:hypothetical protein Acr_21g0002510 [Actinidia rufa]
MSSSVQLLGSELRAALVEEDPTKSSSSLSRSSGDEEDQEEVEEKEEQAGELGDNLVVADPVVVSSLDDEGELEEEEAEISSSASIMSLKLPKDKGKKASDEPSRKRLHETRHISVGGSQFGPTPDVEFWNPPLSLGELGRRVTILNSSQEFETCLAVAQAAMLPCHVADLSKKDGVISYNLLLMQNM